MVAVVLDGGGSVAGRRGGGGIDVGERGRRR